jgi:hypothetical protein
MPSLSVPKSKEISHVVVVFSDGSELVIEKDVLQAVQAAQAQVTAFNGLLTLAGRLAH